MIRLALEGVCIVIELDLSPEEREDRKLKPTHLQRAVAALCDDGLVILHGAVDPAHIAVLRERMLADVAEILALDNVPFQFNGGHLQQDPPPFPPYLFRDVLVNDFVVEVTRTVLGEGVRNAFYSGNTCLPNTTQQPLHVDSGQLWPDLAEATPAYGIVVNVPVVDATPENGSTELWPGTHLDTTRAIGDGDIKVAPEIEARLRAEVRPLQPNVPAGSVLIRDLRLWHRGMPNRTDTPRPMIAMIHWASWWRVGTPLLFPKGTEALFAASPLATVAEFVEEPIDYLNRNAKYDYEE
jgi:hypothetical protein